MNYLKVNTNKKYALINGINDAWCVTKAPSEDTDIYDIKVLDATTGKWLNEYSGQTLLDEYSIDTEKGSYITVENCRRTTPKNIRILGKPVADGSTGVDMFQNIRSIGDDGGIEVNIYRRNLFDWVTNECPVDSTGNVLDETYGNASDGVINASYTHGTQFVYWLSNISYLPNGYYKISADVRFASDTQLDKFYLGLGEVGAHTAIGVVEAIVDNNYHRYATTLKLPEINNIGLVFQAVCDGDSYSNLDITFKNIMIEKVESKDDTIVPDYETCSRQTITLPYTLRNFYVKSGGGQYTTSYGTSFLCDEIDFLKRKHIQRIGVIESYSNEPISGDYYSTTGDLTEGATIFYRLDTPIESDLSDDLIIKFRSLTMNQNLTIITNSENAYMELTYAISSEISVENMYESLQLPDNQYMVVIYGNEDLIDTNDVELIGAVVSLANGASVSGSRMIEYYPPVISGIREFQSIVDSDGMEVDYIKAEIWNVMNNAYLTTMNEVRIADWEKALKIVPLPNSTVSDRRDVIVARLRGQGKLNTSVINAIVNAFTGGTATSWIESSTLYVEITPPPTNKQYKFENVENELRKRVPAHLGLVVTRNYYTWGEVNNNFDTWQDVEDNFDTWEDVLLFTNS